jgi:hypothetical protein
MHPSQPARRVPHPVTWTAAQWDLFEPPAGLTDEWTYTFTVVAELIRVVATLPCEGIDHRHFDVRQIPLETLADYLDLVRYHEKRVKDVLSYLRGRAPNAKEVGQTILAAIQPIDMFLAAATSRRETANRVAAFLERVRDALDGFDAPAWMSAWAAAVTAAGDVQLELPLRSNEVPTKRMTIEEANRKAMDLARKKKEFFLLSERRQASLIGCACATWRKTPFYKKAKVEKTKVAKRMAEGNLPASTAVVSLTDELEAVTGKGRRDEVLQQLIEEQKADNEPSPLDEDRPKKVHSRKHL